MQPDNQKFDDKFAQLRDEAIKLLKQNPDFSSQSSTDINELIQELNIHQTELLIQNEELKQAQIELAKISQDYESLYELAPCGYITLNRKGIISRINKAALKLLGEEYIRLNYTGFSSCIENGWGDLYHAALKNAATSGIKQCLDLKLKKNSEELLWIQIEIDALRDDEDQVIEWRLVFMDVTQKYIAETKAKSLEIQLQQSRKLEAIGVLAGGIAHDFNNILYPIIGFSELTLQDLPENSSVKENVEDVLQGAKRAAELVRQILVFTSQKHKKVEPLLVQSIVKESLNFLRSTIPTNIEISKEIDSKPIYILGDPVQLYEVIMNLCTNAYQAMELVGGVLTVSVGEEQIENDINSLGIKPGKYCKINIQDTGPGISEEHLNKIYDPYFTTKDVGKGSGLGLSVVHGIVNKHSGSIHVKSKPGETIFTVYFPITTKSEGSDREVHECVSSACVERILFVDDEEAIVKLITRSLKILGYKIRGKTSSTEALEEFQENPYEFDIVITDMTMPNLLGTQLIGEIRKIRPDIPVILCSGYSKQINDDQIRELSISEYVNKPILIEELSKKIRNIFDNLD